MKFLLIGLLALLSMNAWADVEELMKILGQKQENQVTWDEAVRAGNDRALLCKYCHGEDGNSKKNTIPNLAAQNVAYLITQFELFASGERNNKTMNELAKILTAEDKVNIALFYASQKVSSQTPYRPELAATGKQIYDTQCFFCHGKDAHGKEGMPYIAGQPSEYLRRTLTSYTSTIVKRANSPMSQVAQTLKKDQIEALAAYLTTLQ